MILHHNKNTFPYIEKCNVIPQKSGGVFFGQNDHFHGACKVNVRKFFLKFTTQKTLSSKNSENMS